MPIIDDIKALCDRLAPLGWRDFLLAATGNALDIQAQTNAALRTQLTKDLPSIDRNLTGLEDFAPAGRRAATAGLPSHSLLYHCLATPLLVRDHLGNSFEGFATPAELDLLENFIFSLAPLDLPAFIQANGGASKVAVVLFSYEYRPATDTVDAQHADLTFSRTGIARVGTAPAHYFPESRGYWPEDDRNPNNIRVLPAKYAAWIAVKKKGSAARITPILDNSQGQASGEPNRDFWIPVHKIFPGPECLKNQDLSLTLASKLFNLKIQRVHQFLGTSPLPTGFPYVLEDEDIGALSTDPECGPGWLTPTVTRSLVEPAIVNGTPVTFRVTSARVDAFAAFAPGKRGVPEYVHARTRLRNGQLEDLNEHTNVITEMKRKAYDALHYIDFTGEGWVTITSPELANANLQILPAYALVTAPDLYPASGQYELSEWSRSNQVPPFFRDSLWSIDPTPLSETRLPANLQLPGNPFSRTDRTITAVVGIGDRAGGPPPLWPQQRDARRTSMLPDDAAGVFAPGWDVALDRTPGSAGVDHLAAYGLGSPFPEDAKLCAALSTFWPAVAPDVYRTFVKPVGNTNGTIAPMTDEEIGQIGTLPWDGIPGPRVVTDGAQSFVEFPAFLNADYVQQALENRFSIRLTAQIAAEEYQARVIVACRFFSVLSNLGNLRAERNRWLILSFREVTPGDPDLQAAQNQAGVVLQGKVYFARLCRSDAASVKVDARTERMPLVNDTLFFASAQSVRVLIKRTSDLRFAPRASEP